MKNHISCEVTLPTAAQRACNDQREPRRCGEGRGGAGLWFNVSLAIAGLLLAACTRAPESGAVLFEDDFSAPDSGWPAQADVEATTGYIDGEYQIAVQASQLTVWSTAGKDFADVILEVDTRTAGGPNDNAFGVVCRFQDDDNFYFMLVSADGFYGIGAVVDREARFIHGEADVMDYSGVILAGEATSTITATCVGETLILTLNGQELANATATEFSRGDVGLIARSFLEPGVDVRFDNLRVVQP